MMRISKTYRTHRMCQVLWVLTVTSLDFTLIFEARYCYYIRFQRREFRLSKGEDTCWDHAARQR